MRYRETASRAYTLLPAPVRSVAATARGLYLRAWRYGGDSERLVAEALEREHWNESRWATWQEERLAFLLHRAATMVPYYRALWSGRRQRGDKASWEQLSNWPVLEKEALRESPQSFVADDRSRRWMFHEHTSGTTGTSLDLWRSRQTVRAWYALNEARWRGWYGVSARDRWAMFGGQVIVSAAQTKPPFWVWNHALRQLYCSSYHLSPGTASAYLAELRYRRVRYVLGYTSALHALAVTVLERGLPAPHLTVAVANAEPVYPHQRAAISQAFSCPVRETYGLAEMVAAAGECEHGALHLWPEVGVLEVLTETGAAMEGGAGDFVATGLINADMPLIRYRIGDRGALSTGGVPCPCGRALPRLASIEGRNDDVLWTRDGRAIGRLDPVFKARLPMREAQIVQETLDRVRVRYVPVDGFSPADASALSDRLRERMGDVHVIFEAMSAIPRERNGKFRSVVCALAPEERARIGSP